MTLSQGKANDESREFNESNYGLLRCFHKISVFVAYTHVNTKKGNRRLIFLGFQLHFRQVLALFALVFQRNTIVAAALRWWSFLGPQFPNHRRKNVTAGCDFSRCTTGNMGPIYDASCCKACLTASLPVASPITVKNLQDQINKSLNSFTLACHDLTLIR